MAHNFNSIKVRLKRPRFAFQESSCDDFNSIKVRLKRLQGNTFVSKLNFNSIKVRLKLTLAHHKPLCLIFQFHKGTIKTLLPRLATLVEIDFNSIKVRLKPSRPPLLPAILLFQFHKGTIKTC